MADLVWGIDCERIALHTRDGSVCAWAVVDVADFPHLSARPWCLSPNGYALGGFRHLKHGGRITMHRFVLGLEPGDGLEVDHINRNRLDNRRANLRICTRAENGQNVPGRPGAASRFRGVFYSTDAYRTKPWRARVRLNGRNVHVGYFASEEEAGVAAAEWRAENMPFAVEERS